MIDPKAWARLASSNTAMLLASARVIQERLALPTATSPQTRPARERELTTMVVEKWAAAAESALAVSTACAEVYVRAGWAAWRAWTGASLLAPGSFATSARTRRVAGKAIAAGLAATPGVLAAGLAPFARRVHANDRRFARRRRAR